EVHIRAAHINFPHPHLLHPHRAADVFVQVAVDGVPANGDGLIIGDIQGGTGDAGVGVGRVEGEHVERLPIVHGHTGIGGAEVHAHNHGCGVSFAGGSGERNSWEL